MAESRFVSPARLAAARALLAVDDGSHADEALARLAPGDSADRSMTWNLVLGVLRNRPELDALITKVAKRPLWSLEPTVRVLLWIGLYELRHTRVPPHAAVDQAVEASRKLKVGHASGLVNAVLRRQQGLVVDDQLGHPTWVSARWRARYGADADTWMKANNQPAPIHIVAKEDPSGVAAAFQHRGVVLVPAGEGVFRLPSSSGAMEALPGYEEGQWWVMDPSAVAVADLVPPGAGRVLDTCAAPGGKSFRISSRGTSGYRPVLATDVLAERLGKLKEGAQRLGLPVEARQHDWSLAPLQETFEAVIVDAPCTSLGLLRRHPDLRWRREEKDIYAAAQRQKKILRHAAACVAPGGVLVYAVCSPEPEEGPQVVATLGWPVEEVFCNAPALDGQDAFWGCRLRRPEGS